MTQEQLSIRSTKARRLAHKLAKKEQRTVSQIVERALENYSNAKPSGSKAKKQDNFWIELRKKYMLDEGPDVDLYALAREGQKPYEGIDL